jgi:hypothetical protein
MFREPAYKRPTGLGAAGCQQNPQGLGMVAGPQTSGEDVQTLGPGQPLDAGLPGHFVSPELRADTARFLEEVKTRIRLRVQAEQPSPENPLPRVRA